MKQLIVFDLDGTLAESKSPLSAEVGELLGDGSRRSAHQRAEP